MWERAPRTQSADHEPHTCDSLDHSQGGMTPRQQALQVARQRIRFPSTDARIHQVVHTLAVALGAIRTEAGSIKALHLRCMPC